MTNIPKPDLERGAYIVYTDEPGEVLSPGSTGGGGGAVFLEAKFVDMDSPLEPQFSFNDVKNALDGGQVVLIKIATSEGVQANINYALVYHLASDETPGDEAYIVNTVAGKGILMFSSTDPDVPMTDDTV